MLARLGSVLQRGALPIWRHALQEGTFRALYVRLYSSTVSMGEGRATDIGIRNIAIIAHVDHGKTTLVDCLLRQSGTVDSRNRDVRLMDSNELEKERGITILAKCTSIQHKQHRINIVDTPGHADFGGEVERALAMVDGVILVVDATEGPMAQTKFVLAKALKQNLLPIVVQNKVDRETSRCDEVDCELLELFMALNATDQQLDFPTVYASAKDGWAFLQNPYGKGGVGHGVGERINGDMSCLFDLIISRVSAPLVHRDRPFSLLVNSVESSVFVGKCLLGRVESGMVKIGDRIRSISPDGLVEEENRVTRMFIRRGLEQIDVEEAAAGDIISLAGIQLATVNHTIANPEVTQPLKVIPVDPPTVSMTFLVNNSPLSGSEGKGLTRITLGERLKHECQNNISLCLEETDDPDCFKVSGRGELQLGILVETIRREGYELAVSPPQVLLKQDSQTGQRLEPIEEVTVDCEQEHTGTVIEKLSKRRAELTRMAEGADGKCRLIFKCPMRGLIGFAAEFKNDTHGTGLLCHSFLGYEPFKGHIELSRKGCLISMADGVVTAHAVSELESRGVLFVTPGTRVYSGMVIGECSRQQDLEVNPCRAKVLTNIRSSVKEDFYRLTPPKLMPLEEMIAYMAEDEILEVTPKSIRLRKADLDPSARKNRARAKRALAAN